MLAKFDSQSVVNRRFHLRNSLVLSRYCVNLYKRDNGYTNVIKPYLFDNQPVRYNIQLRLLCMEKLPYLLEVDLCDFGLSSRCHFPFYSMIKSMNFYVSYHLKFTQSEQGETLRSPFISISLTDFFHGNLF